MPDDLKRLRAGTVGWVRSNAGFLDSPSGTAQLPAVPRAKAFLQLAGMHLGWARVAPEDPDRAEVGELVRQVWKRPELPEVFATEPRYARQYSLMFCALAPTVSEVRREVLARLADDGYLARVTGSPYLRLEIAYYKEMAGIGQGGGVSYRDLYAESLLAGRTEALPISDAEACTIAHTIFYLCDYGLRAPELEDSEVERIRRIVVELTDHYLQRDEWDNVAKFLLAQSCLGLDPVRTPSGQAGIRLLADVQEACGAIPSPAVRLLPDPAATRTQRFRKAYQTTLMTALMSLMVSSACT